jgi:putative ABC transport system permease protein
MILLRLITWPYVRKHALRTALTVAGIALGVAVLVGMNAANQSVLAGFARTVDRIAGKTELEVTAGEPGFPEDVLEQVQAVPAVRVAVPVIEAVVDTNLPGEGSLLVLGVDMTGDRSLRDYDLESGEEAVVDDPLVFLAQPDSIILSRELAARNGLVPGSPLTLATLQGDRRFTVRGIMRTGGLTSAFGGKLAVMDIYAAQKMFGRGRTFDRIDLGVAPGRTLAECARDVQERIGRGFLVAPPASRGQHFEAMLAAHSLMMGACSLFALFIGMFIIYNSFAIAVTERRSEIGILRALGATRAHIQGLFLAESAGLGLVGSLIGVGLGLLIAHAITAAVGTLVGEVYGVAQAQGGGEVVAGPGLLLGAVGIGIATSLVAALVPSRAAARVDPVQALQKGKYQLLTAGEIRGRALLALGGGLLSVACLVLGRSRTTFYASYLLALVVALLLTPSLSLALARTIRPVLKWLRPVEGALAVDSLVQAPRRTSASVAALMLSLALVVAFAGTARAGYGSIMDWVHTALNPDLSVLPSPSIVDRTIRFPPHMADELAALPGVARVQTVREARVVFRGKPVMLIAADLDSVGETMPVNAVAGDAREMFRRAGAGEGVIVSDNLAQLRSLQHGQVLELPAPRGTIRLPIVGIIVEYSDQQGSILIDRSVFERHWQDDSVNFFRLYLQPGAEAPAVKQHILDRYAGQRRVFVVSSDEVKRYVLRVTDQWLGMTYVQVAVAVLVAILGIVNTLTVSITDRRRELGVLRAVGGMRGQIRRTIWMEALAIGTLGLALGVGWGAVNLYYVLQVVRQDVAGIRLDYQFPTLVALAVVPTMLAAAFVAALWPAEAAVRGSLVEALEYE